MLAITSILLSVKGPRPHFFGKGPWPAYLSSSQRKCDKRLKAKSVLVITLLLHSLSATAPALGLKKRVHTPGWTWIPCQLQKSCSRNQRLQRWILSKSSVLSRPYHLFKVRITTSILHTYGLLENCRSSQVGGKCYIQTEGSL